MAGNLIVGFSAAGTATGLVPGAQPNPGAAGGVPGGFARLLAALLGTAGEPTGDAVAAAAVALAPDAAAKAGLPVPPVVTGTEQPEFDVPAVPDEVLAAEENLPAAAAPSLLDLLRALTALDAAAQGGQTIDPQLRQQLDEALEALAAYFELSPAAADGVAIPLAAHLLPATAPAGPAPAGGIPPAADPSAVPEPAAATTPTKAAEAAARPAAPPSPLLARLAEKLQSLGDALEAAAEPELAKRLDAVAERLMSARVDPQKLAAIGLDADAVKADAPLAKALELLLRPAPEAKPAAAPPPFSAATLALPPEVAAPRPERQPLQPPPRPEAPAPSAPEAREAEPAQNGRAADRPIAPEASAPARNAATNPPAAVEPPAAEAKPLPAAAAATAVAATAAATSAKTVHAAYQSPPQQLNLPQVAFEMVRQFQAGNSRFQIRLDPPELGRIDVRMDMDRDGNVMARMTVERSETLDLMQRDQRALERALAQAGLDSARTSLEFSLRHQGSGREQRGSGEPVFRDGNGNATAEPDAPLPPNITHHRGLVSPSGVNLFV